MLNLSDVILILRLFEAVAISDETVIYTMMGYDAIQAVVTWVMVFL